MTGKWAPSWLVSHNEPRIMTLEQLFSVALLGIAFAVAVFAFLAIGPMHG
jgi:hypothetical protein